MSLAQKTAYEYYHHSDIGTLAPEVQKQLIILILNGGKALEESTEIQYTPEDMEYRDRACIALREIEDGKAHPIEEFFAEAESTYPWLKCLI